MTLSLGNVCLAQTMTSMRKAYISSKFYLQFMQMSSASKGPTNYFKAARSSLKNTARSNL